jgi:hypothetical protein
MLVGSGLGAVASPLVSEAPGRVGFTAEIQDVVDVGVRVEAPVTPSPIGPAGTSPEPVPTRAAPAVPAESAPLGADPPAAPAPATSTTDPAPVLGSPSATGTSAAPATTTGSTALPASTTPPPGTERTLCAQLTMERAAKLVAPDELRSGLEVASEQPYGVVVALIAPQSSQPDEEQRLRLSSVAAFAELAVEDFSGTEDGRWAATMTNTQLCRVLYLHPVAEVEVEVELAVDVGVRPPGPPPAPISTAPPPRTP